MHLALGEALMWRLVTAARLLSSATAPPATSANATAAAAHAHALSAAPGAQGTAAQAISELPLQIDVMNITDVDMKLSFKADAMSRPRIANQVRTSGARSGRCNLLAPPKGHNARPPMSPLPGN
eukprot:1158533-Pelagomonas_calceolata.AAC.8